MSQSILEIRAVPLPDSRDVLDEILRQGARELLARTVQAEVAEWIDARRPSHRRRRSPPGRPQRRASGARDPYRPGADHRATAAGPQPSAAAGARDVHAQRPAAVPPATKNIDEAIPWLYLKGISTGNFPEALQGLFGIKAKGLSANTVTRLKAGWEEEYGAWNKRSLKGKHYVYVWADGVHFNVRLEDDRQCILVLIGTTADGKKELIAVTDGYRESRR